MAAQKNLKTLCFFSLQPPLDCNIIESMFIVKKLTCIVALAVFVFLSGALLAEGISNGECLGCHSDNNLKRGAGPASGTLVFVAEDALKGTPHETFNCVDCHADLKELPHPPHLGEPACGGCHPQADEEHKASIHGIAEAKENPDAPRCYDCHGKHQIKRKAELDSPINQKNVAVTCARCHANPGTTKRNHFNMANPLKDYQESVHFHGIQSGLKAATCSECHGNHLIRKSMDPRSNTNRANIPKTCGKCHAGILKIYDKSIHGVALANGVPDAPVCTDCHGEHRTGSKTDPSSTIYPLNISSNTCSRCHNDKKIMGRYGIDTARTSSYNDSYHGLALKGGQTLTANCSSCHGSHEILEAADPRSTVNPANIVRTCGKCHKTANENFARIPVHTHFLVQGTYEWGAEVVRWLYIALIVLTIGAMMAHNAVILSHYIRQKLQQRRQGLLYQRFFYFEVLNHFVLVFSFTTLVITGFALKFPDAFWVQALSWIGLHEVLRGIIHRFAGSILICQGIIHGFWQIGTSRGRGELIALLPWFTDLKDVFHNVFYHLGFVSYPPHFGRYTYIEKSEY